MTIHGLQKLTLLDYPGKTACTVFTAGCNLRCPFCHNASLVTRINDSGIMTEEEFFMFLGKRRGILDGVCITGGEPLLQNDIRDFIIKIKKAGFLVKLDTNGFMSSRLSRLTDEKLIDYIAMDIKNSPAKYAVTSGIEALNIDEIYQSIKTILNSGIDYEFRTTAVFEYHDISDFCAIAEMIKGAKAYYIQNFEDSGDTVVKGLHPLPEKMLLEAREEAMKILSHVVIRGI
ncbi:MAG: anaerobic ribonucleoside-triphosphate reductase activating protein [Eubacteriales bacterium]|nr:anaerobic ribonucleoside-triphosphate reductase activating protein [Eubacteriales bacterium]